MDALLSAVSQWRYPPLEQQCLGKVRNGKTTASELVSEKLRGTLLSYDKFGDTNVEPPDFYEWTRAGADLRKFDSPEMASAVEAALQDGLTECIVLDYPFGRDHPRFQSIIDLSAFIDTPLDVAMAQRILRDHMPTSSERETRQLRRLRDELRHYLERARVPYLDTFRHRETSDLVLDGCRSPEELSGSIVCEVRRMTGEPHNTPLQTDAVPRRR